ncbi:hypothetical protein MNBD_GAMMA18-1268 [hydrothermal vent metagenome]|uniref:YtkA-like domain-containing protein n=1 Tax=hydrothermal vent metagenome TaxID=652676 RepID=A0A3B0ZU81_9ZZZZ
MKKVKQSLSVITFAALVATAGPLQASPDGHEHGDSHSDSHGSMMNHDMHGSDKGHGDHKGHGEHKDHGSAMSEMFLVEKDIDGYKVSFHVMKAKPGKEMGGSHDFMVKVEKEGKALTDMTMNTKVVHPSGKSETKKAMKMGDWMMAGYDLGHDGKHQLMILFKTADGKKHQGGVHYPAK